MRSTSFRILIMLICVLTAAAGVQAAPPQREKQVVYGITPWTGKEYGGTFAPKGIDKIYLLAGADNVINTLETEVYFWPITNEYMANWFESREVVEGKLQILQDGKEIRVLERQPYAHFYPDGFYAGVSEILVGDAAEKKFQEYRDAIEGYWQAVNDYRQAYAEYEQRMAEILEEVSQTGKTYTEDELPKPPEQPSPPIWYVTEATEAFIVNLPVGEYVIRTIDDQGRAVDGTEKKLKVFDKRRTGVGYQIIPESKWTRPVQSDDASQILYLEGTRTMYLKAFRESEYNQHDYLKMTSLEQPLAGAGATSAYMWVHETEVPNDTKVQILQGGKVVMEAEYKPYYVKQTPGYALGYEIVEFDPEADEFAGRRPSFEAVKLELEPGTYEIRAVDSSGRVLEGSVRDIRSVNVVPMWQLYVLSLLPLLVGLVVVVRRRRTRVVKSVTA
ncbi:MAG: hypothetical protein GX341_07930 [Firmicutes bacterium]|jgi:hypothetical protein|nr:hypothetical protein [Bacillota bacterium]